MPTLCPILQRLITGGKSPCEGPLKAALPHVPESPDLAESGLLGCPATTRPIAVNMVLRGVL